MALGPLPYSFVRTGRNTDAHGVDIITGNVVDNAGAVRGNARVHVDDFGSISEDIRRVVERQIIRDAPNKAAAFDAIAAGVKVGG